MNSTFMPMVLVVYVRMSKRRTQIHDEREKERRMTAATMNSSCVLLHGNSRSDNGICDAKRQEWRR